MERSPFAPEEWYHCFSRGIEKRKTFSDRRDYERFLQLLYLCNNTKTVHRSDLRDPSLTEVLSLPRAKTMVSIGAFCLMPNHFHLLLKEEHEGGISAFMQKLGTAYTMYFNLRNDRSGGLFAKPFRSRHIGDDRYFQYVLQYIHCNPAELYEPGWKDGQVTDMEGLEKKLLTYPYGSLSAHYDQSHVLRPILGQEIFENKVQPELGTALEDARLYYLEHVKATP